LHDISDHDIIIYRYLPHGSKNINDLKPLLYPNRVSAVSQVHVWCHDQEPFTAQALPVDANRTIHNLLDCRHSFFDRCLLLHSEQNSLEIQKVSNFMQPVYYWCHALLALDWFRYAQHDPALNTKTGTRTFLIYNRAWSGTREYRLHFADQLIGHNLVQHCLTSFAPVDNDVHWQQHQFVNQRFAPTRALDQHLSVNTFPSWASADYTNHDYAQTQIEIVLETLFDDQRHHLTEKALRPIACARPFLLASTPGALQYLKTYGFVTFDPYINETYDGIIDPVDRIAAIIEEMQRIVTHDNPISVFKELFARARYNQQHFFSGNFFASVVAEYKQNLNQAIHAVQTSVNKKFFHSYVKAMGDKSIYSRQDTKEIWLRYHQLLKNR
jgi:hypothetical protein